VTFALPGCSEQCPYLAGKSGPLDFPIGQVRRVAPVRDTGSDDVDETRRNVLKLAGVGALVLAAGGLGAASIQYVQPPSVGLSSYPKVQLIDVDGRPLTLAAVESEYNVAETNLFLFNYPLRNEPNFFINLARSMASGRPYRTPGLGMFPVGSERTARLSPSVPSVSIWDALRRPSPTIRPRFAPGRRSIRPTHRLNRSTSTAPVTGRPTTPRIRRITSRDPRSCRFLR